MPDAGAGVARRRDTRGRLRTSTVPCRAPQPRAQSSPSRHVLAAPTTRKASCQWEGVAAVTPSSRDSASSDSPRTRRRTATASRCEEIPRVLALASRVRFRARTGRIASPSGPFRRDGWGRSDSRTTLASGHIMPHRVSSQIVGRSKPSGCGAAHIRFRLELSCSSRPRSSAPTARPCCHRDP
jgi:hypothetical protein